LCRLSAASGNTGDKSDSLSEVMRNAIEFLMHSTNKYFTSLFSHLLLLRPSPLELEDRNTIVLSFPTLPVHTKALRLRLRDAREHAHLHDDLAWVSSRLRFHRTTQCKKERISKSAHQPNPIQNILSRRYNLLAILLTKVPKHTIPAARRFIVIVLERAVAVFDLHFRGVEQHV
jgi:hypothetical protein